MSRVVLLDSGPLGLVTNPRLSPKSLECADWLQDLLAGGAEVVVPEIAAYEVRRELPQADTLARELGEYEIRIRITEDANDRYGAFRVGTHDDLVNALGLAIQIDRIDNQCSVFRVWERPGS